jgi:flagellar biosynthesis/type III secretory pathway protein FliH
MLIAKLALRKDLGIEEIFNNKVAIARQLLALNLSAEKIRKLIVFLKLYVRFEEKEISDKFDEEIKLLTNKFETMGIIEQVVDLAKQEGMEAGLNEGMKAGLNKAKEDFVKNFLKHTSHSVKEIAKLVDVSEKFVLTIRDGFTHVSR